MRQKFLALLAFSALSITKSVLAEPSFQSTEKVDHLVHSQTEKNQMKDGNCTYKSECGCSSYQTCCAMLPLPINNNGHVFVEGEYLYWKTYGLFPYIGKRDNVTPFNNGTGITDVGKYWSTGLRSIDFSSDSGYRLTLGFYLSKCFSFRTVFRQFDASGTDSFETTSTGVLAGSNQPEGENITFMWSRAPVYINSSTAFPSWQVGAKQRYREKVFDMDFARAFSCSRFTFNAFTGIRFAWLKFDSSIDLKGIASGPLSNAVYPLQGQTDINNRFNLGVGLHVGTDMHIDLPYGFGFYGNSQLAALIGQFKYRINTHQLESTLLQPDLTQVQKTTDFQTNWSLGAGLNWNRHFTNCNYFLGFKVGYEVNIWPNFISVFNVQIVQSGLGIINTRRASWVRSLLTHGLTLSGRFDF